jgi:hypothetical protein
MMLPNHTPDQPRCHPLKVLTLTLINFVGLGGNFIHDVSLFSYNVRDKWALTIIAVEIASNV